MQVCSKTWFSKRIGSRFLEYIRTGEGHILLFFSTGNSRMSFLRCFVDVSSGLRIAYVHEQGGRARLSGSHVDSANQKDRIFLKIPTDPWNIPQTRKTHLFMKEILLIFVFWGTWGMFQGSVGIFLDRHVQTC